jgi:hypothetical protein
MAPQQIIYRLPQCQQSGAATYTGRRLLGSKEAQNLWDILNMKPVFTSVADQIPKLAEKFANDLDLMLFMIRQRRPYRHSNTIKTKLQTRQSQPATTVQPSFHPFPSIALLIAFNAFFLNWYSAKLGILEYQTLKYATNKLNTVTLQAMIYL